MYLRRLTQNYLSVVKYYLWNCEFVISLQDSPFFQNYDLNLKEGILGDGSFSVCRKCTNRQTGGEFAVKIVSRKIDCTREINLLRACQGHHNIVNLHEVYYDEVSLHRLPFEFNPFRSYVGPRPTLRFSHSAPMSGDVRHFFFCVCSPAPLWEPVRHFVFCVCSPAPL